MEQHKLSTEYRGASGKSTARKFRMEGKIPGVIYGHKKPAVELLLDESEISRILHLRSESAMLSLSIKGKVSEKCNAIIRDVQIHEVTGRILHVDFQRVSLDEKIRVEVPVSLTGEARGIKESGGILEHGLRTLNVLCTPATIPDSIEVDVSDLDIGKSIHVGDIMRQYPEVDFLDASDSNLAIVVPPIVETKPEAEEEMEEGADETAEPELIAKDKKEKETEEAPKEE